MSIGPNYKFTNPFSENSQKEENGYSLFHDLIYNFACRINKDVKKNIILAKSFGESMDQLIFKENDIDRKPEDCNIVREPILNDNLKADIFFVILETFLDAFCLFIIPVLAIFMSSEFNLGKNFKASDFFLPSKRIFIFFKAFLYLLFLALLTAVCLEILLILFIADLVFAIFRW